MSSAYDNSLDSPQFTFVWNVTLNATVEGEVIDVALGGDGGFDDFNNVIYLTIEGDAGGTPLDAELRVIDDLLYVRATDPTSGEDTGWFALNGPDLMGIPVDFETIGDELAAEAMGDSNIDQDGIMRAAFGFAAIDPSQYLFTSRADDGDLTTFTLDVGLSDLFRADGMTDVTAEAAAAFGEELPRMEAAGVNGILAELLAGTTISVDQTFDTANNVVDLSSIFIAATIDPADIGESGEVIDVLFTLDIEMTSYNESVTVEEPADFVEIPVSLLSAQIPDEFLLDEETSGSFDGGVDGTAETSEAGPMATDIGSLSCSTAATGLGAQGDTFTGTCPASCDGVVWGTKTYTDDSSICTAAVHAGAIPASGGQVTFTLVAGQDSYAASESNGISTFDYGAWGGSFVFSSGSASTSAAPAATGPSMANSYSFPSGLTFGYPSQYTIQTESDVVTVIWVDSTPTFIQIYDMGSLFGDMDMGRAFFEETYGSSAASAWNFDFNIDDFVDVEFDGKVFSVLDFEGEGGGGPTAGTLVIVPLDGGGYTYVQSFAVMPAPDGLRDDTIAIARSISG